jgi:hypothetical protein
MYPGSVRRRTGLGAGWLVVLVYALTGAGEAHADKKKPGYFDMGWGALPVNEEPLPE